MNLVVLLTSLLVGTAPALPSGEPQAVDAQPLACRNATAVSQPGRAQCERDTVTRLQGQWRAQPWAGPALADEPERLRRHVAAALARGLDGDNVAMYVFVLMQLGDGASDDAELGALITHTVAQGRSLREGFSRLSDHFWATHAGKRAGHDCGGRPEPAVCRFVIVENAEDAAAGEPPLICGQASLMDAGRLEIDLMSRWESVLAKSEKLPTQADRLRVRRHVQAAMALGLSEPDVRIYVLVLMQLAEGASGSPAFQAIVRNAAACGGGLADGLQTLPEAFWETFAADDA